MVGQESDTAMSKARPRPWDMKRTGALTPSVFPKPYRSKGSKTHDKINLSRVLLEAFLIGAGRWTHLQ